MLSPICARDISALTGNQHIPKTAESDRTQLRQNVQSHVPHSQKFQIFQFSCLMLPLALTYYVSAIGACLSIYDMLCGFECGWFCRTQHLFPLIGYQQCFLYNLSSLILTPARAEIIFQKKKGIPSSLFKHNVLLRLGHSLLQNAFIFLSFLFFLLKKLTTECTHDVRRKRSTSLPWSFQCAPLTACTPVNTNKSRPRVVLQFPSGTVERA